ncbi:MAG: ABC transporter substrate-binding protein [Methylobacteriaceae bacterium]|nr:ABC transporter substrate-binding protein [Methylobacteriaceae bacterium]
MRTRRALRRTVLIFTSGPTVIAIVLAMAVAAALLFRFNRDWRVYTLAAAGAPDISIAKAVEELHRGIDVSEVRVLAADNPEAASAAVDAGKAQLAIVRSDVSVPKNAGTMLIVHKDAGLLFAGAQTKITKVADLAKKRVGIVPGDAPNVRLFDELLTYYGVQTGSVTHLPLQPEQIGALSASKLIDAVFVIAPLRSPLVEQVFAALSSGEKSRPLLIELKNAEAFAARQPGVSKLDVPAGFFGGVSPQPADDMTTVAVDHQLVASLGLGEGPVDRLTKWFFSMRRALAERAPYADFMEGAETEKGSQFPLHPGATAYYQDTEKSFLDQYGDWFYIIAMVLGGAGSAVATMVGSFQARGRRTAMAVIDELMSIQATARDADTLATLNELDAAINRVALKALHRARENSFDEAGMETLRLAIDEARRAIDVRRAELQGTPEAAGSGVTAFPVRKSEPTSG